MVESKGNCAICGHPILDDAWETTVIDGVTVIVHQGHSGGSKNR